MKLINCEATNFGSYKYLNFDYNYLGLSLIYGPTGSGKSTIFDLASWTLFGETAKDGCVEDVRSWSDLENPTKSVLQLEVNSDKIVITRIRGKGQNDLFWCINESEEAQRGKDLSDSQKKINQLLGFSSSTYFTAAYFSEFSPTSSFFIAKAKDRRDMLETLADLSLPKKVSDACVSEKKEIKETISQKCKDLSKVEGRIEQLIISQESNYSNQEKWKSNRLKQIEELNILFNNFDNNKQEKLSHIKDKSISFENSLLLRAKELNDSIEYLMMTIKSEIYYDNIILSLKNSSNDVCRECKRPYENELHKEKERSLLNKKEANQKLIYDLQFKQQKLDLLSQETNRYSDQIEEIEKQTNPYGAQLEKEVLRQDPFESQITKTQSDLLYQVEQQKDLMSSLNALETRLSYLNILYDLAPILRGELLKQAIKAIQDETNRYLETYFDAELRIEFLLDDSDNLDVNIQKSGYNCNYKQLSKGQRGLLKLTFASAIMQASANHMGIHFSNIFMDEALDGLDDSLKIKAFKLLQEISNNHESVLIIDHSEALQNLFDSKFKVSILEDSSNIEEEIEKSAPNN